MVNKCVITFAITGAAFMLLWLQGGHETVALKVVIAHETVAATRRPKPGPARKSSKTPLLYSSVENCTRFVV
jgi:hypothetical protein